MVRKQSKEQVWGVNLQFSFRCVKLSMSVLAVEMSSQKLVTQVRISGEVRIEKYRLWSHRCLDEAMD